MKASPIQTTQKFVIIDEHTHNQRFDRFIRKYFKQDSRITLAQIYRAIREGTIRINNKKAQEDYRLKDGDMITFAPEIDASLGDAVTPKQKKINHIEHINRGMIEDWVIFENEDRLVFNKPSGISIHPGDGNSEDLCMQDYLERYLLGTSHKDTNTFKPSFGYRLDKETSGVLIAGKTYDALQYINKIIREREITKQYLAVVVGTFPKHLIINKPLQKSYTAKFGRGKSIVAAKDAEDSKPCLTECRLEKTFHHPLLGPLSLIKVHIETGRMHQIRVHTADAGYPVLWDMLYGNPTINRLLFKELKLKKQFLHCWQYSFWDRFSNDKISFEAEIPGYFNSVLK